MSDKPVYLDTDAPKAELTTADIKKAVEVLEANAVPPSVCSECGEKFYVFDNGQPLESLPKTMACGDCMKRGTWPRRAKDEGTADFCVGSPRRFRDHEYQDGACRWCPRRLEPMCTCWRTPEGEEVRGVDCPRHPPGT